MITAGVKMSVCAPCYNHVKFIPEFVKSVLAQGNGDWELNVVDDCSTDGSFDLLRQYAAKDSRIHVVQNDRNRHVCYTGNRAMGMATGDLVTLISCDDVLMPDKVGYDCAFFRNHSDVAALYTEARQINGEVMTNEVAHLPKNFSRHYLLRQELFGQNALSIPGLTIRRRVLDEIGRYNPLLRMTQDHELHIRILKDHNVALADHPTVGYRRHGDNLSKKNDAYFNAAMNEGSCFLADHYLQGVRSVDDLVRMIPECLQYGVPEPEAIPYFLARYALEHGDGPEIRIAGMHALYRFMIRDENLELVERRYGFLAKDFMKLCEMQVFGSMKELAAVRADLACMKNSVSYKLGLALTWPMRKAFRLVKPKNWEC